MPDNDHHGYLFKCKLVSFDKQPVPAYWSLNGTNYFPETVAPDVVVESGLYDRATGNGEFSLHVRMDLEINYFLLSPSPFFSISCLLSLSVSIFLSASIFLHKSIFYVH